jgi:hypothetical protein
MKTVLTAILCCTIALAASCVSRQPLPVEPYSPDETATEPVASAEPADAAVAAPVPALEARGRECEKLAAAINEDNEALKSGLEKALDPKGKKDGLSELAATVEQAGERVQALELRNPKLTKAAGEYRGLMADLAQALRQTQQDRAKKDKAALGKDLEEIRRIDKAQAELVERINALCED